MTFLAGHGEICPPHGRSTWRPADQPTTRRSTWISCMILFKKAKKSMWIGVLWAGLRDSMWIAHVGGKFRHGLLQRTDIIEILLEFDRNSLNYHFLEVPFGRVPFRFFKNLVHHRPRSQIASDQRLQPITDTLLLLKGLNKIRRLQPPYLRRLKVRLF